MARITTGRSRTVCFITGHGEKSIRESGPSGYSTLHEALMLENSPAEACRFWQSGRVEPGFDEPVVTDKPVLLLAGEPDDVAALEAAGAALLLPEGGAGAVVDAALSSLILRKIVVEAGETLTVPEEKTRLLSFYAASLEETVAALARTHTLIVITKGDLVDQERRGDDAKQARAGIIDTALAHHLVSKYTSLVAVDKTPVRPAGKLLAREQVPNLMAHGQSSRAIFGFPATATLGPEMRRRGLLMVLATLLMIAMSAWYRRVTHGTPR
mgnify:CR=1 FL=1